MPANYILLERIELNASAASITFNNIPQTGYTDLKVVASSRGSSSGPAEANRIHFNGDTTNTNYTGKRLLGSGTAASSDQTTAITPGFFNDLAGATANTFANSEVYIPNYTGSNSKSYSIDTVTENNGTEAYSALVAVRWSGTAAITSMTFTPESAGNFVSGSTFSLYGLAALGTTPVIAPKASGGNRIDYDGTYWIHTFLTSGTFTPQTALSCDYLVVAGGGGGAGVASGGSYGAPGGGAGGLRSTVTATGGGGSLESKLSVASGTAYTVTIGAGGARSEKGSNSVFSTITSEGGGLAPAGSGGSGAGAFSFGTLTPGSGTANQGYAGAAAASNTSPGGGGGAGGAGSSARTGGAGVTTSISGTSTAYAGGGAGGWGGTATAGGGNGGAASTNQNGFPGTVNTGGGGGGSSVNGGDTLGAAGGSGIVIIRYLA
jgi:hypothetical protein